MSTPRTDAAAFSREFVAREIDNYSAKFVLADFARGLERELATADGVLRIARSALRQWTVKYAHLQNECGERVGRVLDYNLPPADHLKALEAIEDLLRTDRTENR